MKKLHIGPNKGFTLIELLVSVSIVIIISSGLFIYFEAIGNGLKNITFKSKTFLDVESFENYFKESLDDYSILKLDGNIFPESTKGFSIVVLTNKDKTNGFLWGTYDLTNEKVIIGDINNYSIYHPFFLSLNQSDISSIESNINTFLTSIPKEKIQYFSNINLIKFGIYDIQNPNMIKLDFVLSFEKYNDFVGLEFKDIIKNPKYKTFKFSLIY
ncbi:prepilin-type N-terminal cleavage/methylation domain-containing protein [Candidatus Gracilibacteria bacterium]|nr:prepilin-type N-terminal cleavage/methylation domain-containing protein [Candidatus Gracilibacteria bacterium]